MTRGRPKQEKQEIDLNSSEARERLAQIVSSIQRIDNQLQILKDERKDIIKDAKVEGFNSKFINSTISKIRKELKAKESELSEEEFYVEIIKSLNIVQI